MKSFLYQLKVFALVFLTAFSAVGREINLLKNPGFELADATWKKSPSTFCQIGAGLNGSKQGFVCQATSPGQYFETPLFDPSNPGGLGYARIYYKGDATLAKLQVLDASNALVDNASSELILGSYATGDFSGFGYKQPLTGKIKLRVVSTAAWATPVTFDDVLHGISDETLDVDTDKVEMVGAVTIAGCSANWSTTSTTVADFTPVTGCTYATSGSAVAPSTNVPGIKFSNLKAGEYKIEAEGYLAAPTSGKSVYLRFWDGANYGKEYSIVSSTSGVVVPSIGQSLTYATDQGAITFSIRAYVDSAGTGIVGGVAATPLTIRVYRYPTKNNKNRVLKSTQSALWAGEIFLWPGSSCPMGTKFIDGVATLRSEAPELFQNIGTNWGDGTKNPDGTASSYLSGQAFNLPDGRGMFARIWDGTAGRDPDKASRIALITGGGGATGNTVGSYQADAFQGHWHGIYSNSGSTAGGNTTLSGASNNGGAVDAYHAVTPTGKEMVRSPTADESGSGTPRWTSETRGKNFTILACMRMNTGRLGAVIKQGVITKDSDNGAVINTVKSVSSAYTATADEESIFANATSGSFPITLPDAATVKGKKFLIKKTDSTANVVTVGTTSSQTIDGAATLPIALRYDFIEVQSDGSNWSMLRSQLSIHASYWVSANFAASTTIPINFDSKEFDYYGAVTVSSTAWKFTAPVGGLYIIGGVDGTPSSTAGFAIYKNGTAYKHIGYSSSTARNTPNSPIRLNAGEYIDIRPTGAFTIIGGTLATDGASNISIIRVSP